ncbi:hypothetical protein KKF84_20765 [Myxococcota bacterium]|nr:hypothetical protein [Myxococcota bacterium]MBU1537757.1 hypothetical protein [Myxococcota bacterium]
MATTGKRTMKFVASLLLSFFLIAACDDTTAPSNDGGTDTDVIDVLDVSDTTEDTTDVVEDVVIPLENCTTDGTDLPAVDNCQHPIATGYSAYGVYFPYVFVIIRENDLNYDFGFYKFNIIDKSLTRTGITQGLKPYYFLAVVPEERSVYWIANSPYIASDPLNSFIPHLYRVNFDTDSMEDITAQYPALRTPLCEANGGTAALHYFNANNNSLLIECAYYSTTPQDKRNTDVYLLNGDTGEINYLADGIETANSTYGQKPSNINRSYFNLIQSNWASEGVPGDLNRQVYWRVDGEVPFKAKELLFDSGTASVAGQMAMDEWYYYGKVQDSMEVVLGESLTGGTIQAPTTSYHQHAPMPLSEKYSNLVGWLKGTSLVLVQTLYGKVQPQSIHELQIWDKETGMIRTAAWDSSNAYYAMASIMAGDPQGRFLIYLGYTDGPTIYFKDLFSAKILDENGNLIQGD